MMPDEVQQRTPHSFSQTTSTMSPPVAISPVVHDSPIFALKNNLAGVQYEAAENYDGDYKFAPIEEAQVSRAMIKRYASASAPCPIAPIADAGDPAGTST